jgi:hypothetical protein
VHFRGRLGEFILSLRRTLNIRSSNTPHTDSPPVLFKRCGISTSTT